MSYIETDQEIMNTIKEFMMFISQTTLDKDRPHWISAAYTEFIGIEKSTILSFAAEYACQAPSTCWGEHIEKVSAFIGYVCESSKITPADIFPAGRMCFCAFYENLEDHRQPKTYEEWFASLVMISSKMHKRE